MIHPRPETRAWREVAAIAALLVGVIFPALGLYVVLKTPPQIQNVATMVSGGAMLWVMAMTSETANRLPSRILFRLRGGPKHLLTCEEFQARLDEAALHVAAWWREMDLTNPPPQLAVSLERDRLGDPVSVRILRPNLGI